MDLLVYAVHYAAFHDAITDVDGVRACLRKGSPANLFESAVITTDCERELRLRSPLGADPLLGLPRPAAGYAPAVLSLLRGGSGRGERWADAVERRMSRSDLAKLRAVVATARVAVILVAAEESRRPVEQRLARAVRYSRARLHDELPCCRRHGCPR